MSQLKERAQKLGLHAIVSDWDHYVGQDWLEGLLTAEEKSVVEETWRLAFAKQNLGNLNR